MRRVLLLPTTLGYMHPVYTPAIHTTLGTPATRTVCHGQRTCRCTLSAEEPLGSRKRIPVGGEPLRRQFSPSFEICSKMRRRVLPVLQGEREKDQMDEGRTLLYYRGVR